MEVLIYIFKLFAGIGLFLFAMYLLEDSLKNLSGRNFKRFLQRITQTRLGAVTGGAIVTGILQSSSMVSLMVLAFVGAGVFTMKNALAIILGANLGTTLTSWLVATLGFKMNIEVAAYPAVFVGGLLLILFSNRKIFKYISYFLFGFGLLFIALSFMKTAMEGQVETIDFSRYTALPLIVFLFIGFIITLLVQSSSVTMALTLSAIYAGAIGFVPAAALALGSETGTTIKILLGAVGGSASKKRVALGNLLFNVLITVVVFLLLNPILYFITDILHIDDPLIGLVTFSSLVNLLGIMLFMPLLNPFAKLLERTFKSTDGAAAAFIGHANVREPETALDLFHMEAAYFIHNSLLFNLKLFEIDTKLFEKRADFKKLNEKRKFFSKTPEEKYEFLKEWQGELQVFYLALRTHVKDEQRPPLNQLISAVRSAMHSVKSVNDIESNISNLRRSSKDFKYNFFIHHKKETEALYHQLNALFTQSEAVSFEKLQAIFDIIQHNYSSALHDFYKEALSVRLEDLDVTTVLNFNRELFTSNKAMLMAVKDFLLDEKQAEEFNAVPVYKT